ncbi:Structural maintenance of chromosomes protein 5 [Microbotryomycetes sp. JL201]|nr:Structural maintenance of chromosomes protein 5 [Microbotryomycetes sp. JL201]
MPPPGRRAAPASDSESDQPGANPSPRAQKRARVQQSRVERDDAARASEDENEQQQSDSVDSQEDDGDSDSDVERDNVSKLVRDKDGQVYAHFVMGSIVRIACRNFLTYDKVEFRPGPALNMVIGPNGTGKSTIACAIAIGLGFKPEILGRSPKLSAFVKQDSTGDVWVEIELKGKPGKKNLVRPFHVYDRRQVAATRRDEEYPEVVSLQAIKLPLQKSMLA